VLLVTHDRYFLDQVATQIIAFHTAPGEEGRVTSFAGLNQWEEWHREQAAGARAARTASAPNAAAPAAAPRKKLSFNLQREWDTIEARVAEAEAKLKGLEAELNSPAIASDAARIIALSADVAAAQAEVERLIERWAELETLRSA
jgi:ATP-binding cassette subfamily F protein uup